MTVRRPDVTTKCAFRPHRASSVLSYGSIESQAPGAPTVAYHESGYALMATSPAWLLLLACAVLQPLAGRFSRVAAPAVVVAASALYVALARTTSLTTGDGLALGSFWITAAALLTLQHRAQARFSALAELCDVDDTTRCLNRRGFDAALRQAATDAMRRDVPVSLLALDLDHFKLVNDRFGHLSGDEVLREVGAWLTDTVGDAGAVARLGGEEFAILLAGADAEQAGVMAERVLAVFRQRHIDALPEGARLTVSIGIACERLDDEHGAESLRARADGALYAAKRNGRNRALLWAPGVHSHATPVRSIGGVARPTARRTP